MEETFLAGEIVNKINMLALVEAGGTALRV
jgi:hypothetical protein